MSLSLKPKNKIRRPYLRVVLAGIGGVGKTSAFCKYAKNPFVVDFDKRIPKDCEDLVTVPEMSPGLVGLKELLRDILAEAKFAHDWLIFDTATQAASLMEEFCIEKDCMGDRGRFNDYGFGNKFMPQYFKEIIGLVDQIQEKHHTNVVFICHTKVKEVKNPLQPPHNKNALDLPDVVGERLKQWADFVGYAWFEVDMDDIKSKRAKQSHDRFISFKDNPSYDAKASPSGYTIPDQLEFDPDGEWASVVFGVKAPLIKTLLEELDELLASCDATQRKIFETHIENAGVRNFGYEELKSFVEAGKVNLKKGKK